MFKKAICGPEIRPIYYGATCYAMVGDSSLDSELPFFSRGEGKGETLAWTPMGASSNRTVPSRAGSSLLYPGAPEASYRPTIWPGKCVSCVARCSFADGTIYSRGYSRIQISSCAGRDPASCLVALVLPPFLIASSRSPSFSPLLPFADFFILRSSARV